MREPRVDVALDARETARMSFGMRAYVRALVAGLPQAAPELRVVALDGGPNLGLDEQLGLPLRIRALRPRLAHFATIYAPLLTPAPYLLTIHDLIHVAFPQFHAPAVAAYYALVVRNLVRRATRIVVDDERTVEECARRLGVAPERCRVVPLGYDPRLAEGSDVEPAPRPYVLYSGNLRPHKDVPALLAAWAALPPPVELDLYVTGTGPEAERLRAFERAGRRLVALGTVSDARLWALYRGARAYVHPALAEGFGLPMLEAAAAGTPVIATRESVPAVVAPYAALFPARDVAALRELLRAAAEGGTAWRERGRRGREGVRAYTWDRCVRATAAVYREILEEAPAR